MNYTRSLRKQPQLWKLSSPITVLLNQIQPIHHEGDKIYSCTVFSFAQYHFQCNHLLLVHPQLTRYGALLTSTLVHAPTKGHIKQLKYQIKSCVKGTKTISEYIWLIKTKSDELALLEKPIDAEDLIEQILTSLSE